MNSYVSALTGGFIIGFSASLFLLFKGRVFGVSGIIGGIVRPVSEDVLWRVVILLGLISGGFLTLVFFPEAFPKKYSGGILELIVAGFLVGFGTQLGEGCTSGHGVCGVSRLSVRSMIATTTFIVFGVLTVFFFHGGGGRAISD
ncbi:MAG: YeeE/YedE family protein [Oligoflexales bacterium]